MLLVIDIGNSDIVFGVHDGQNWLYQFRTPSSPEKSAEFYGVELVHRFLESDLRVADFSKIVLSSVVPDLSPVMGEMIRGVFGQEPLIVGPPIYPKLGMDFLNPQEIGTDLVANATYAYHTYKQTCLVIDFGTALTFTVISGEGKVVGVSIAPGLKTAVKALFKNTAQLPEVPLIMPESAMGTNTVTAIQSGILWGYVGMVKEMIAQIKAEVGQDCKVLATGGLSSILTPLKPYFDEVDVKLTINGLKKISELVDD
jgi:type III pantothenate kinase